MKRSETVSLLSLWICVGVALRNCPKDTLFFYALVPTCDGAADELSCDYLVRGALELAVQHLKQESSILENITPQVSLFEKDNIFAQSESLVALGIGEFHGAVGPPLLRYSKIFTSVFTNQVQVPSLSFNLPDEDIVDSSLYYRTVPSNTYIAMSLVSLLDHFQWYRIAILSSGAEEFVEILQFFMSAFSNHLNESTSGLVDIELVDIFTNDDQMEQSIKRLETRGKIKTFVTFTSPQESVKLICKASQAGLTEAGYVWILPAYTHPQWWRKLQYTSTCTVEELEKALDSTLFVAPTKYPSFTQEEKIHSPKEFREELLDITARINNLLDASDLLSGLLLHSHAVSAYDAVWTLARSWDTVLTQLNCEREFGDVSDTLALALANISKVEFKNLWDRDGCLSDSTVLEESQKYYGQVMFTQLHGGWVCPVALSLPGSRGDSGSIVTLDSTKTHTCPTVAVLGDWIKNFTHPSALHNCSFTFQWKGGSAPAASGFTLVESGIPFVVLCMAFVLVVVFTALPISIAIFNLRYRENKFVKATSPRLSLGITAALILLPCGVFLEGLVHSAHAFNFNEDRIDHICWVEIWLPVFGLTLLYGTLLAKNYRIYCIFYNKTLKKHDDRLTDGALMIPVLLLLLPMVAVCLESIVTGSTHHIESILPLETGDSFYRFIRVSYCTVSSTITRYMVFIYLYLLILPVIVLACLTMRLNSRYGLEGKSAAATTLSVLIGIEYFTILNFLVDRGGNPDGYIIYYTLFATYVIGQTLAILGFNYIPLYVNMYRGHKKSAAMKVESAQEHMRSERYRELQSQATQLRQQLDQIELRIKELRTKSENMTTLL